MFLIVSKVLLAALLIALDMLLIALPIALNGFQAMTRPLLLSVPDNQLWYWPCAHSL
jgi:hypothetical protein